MGYTTNFDGAFRLDKPLTDAQAFYIRRFAETRRMKRDAAKAAELPDQAREVVALPVGPEGAYFVGGSGFAGQDRDESIVEYNKPPNGQPSLWCQWTVHGDQAQIVWDGGEKFYEYIAWIAYLIEHFLKPWGYMVNGEVTWEGEDSGDFGKIQVQDNVVFVCEGARRTYGKPKRYEPK